MPWSTARLLLPSACDGALAGRWDSQHPTCVAVVWCRYVEDGDLWRWQVPGSKEFYSGLLLLSLEYDVNKNPGIFDTLLHLDPDDLISKVGTYRCRAAELTTSASAVDLPASWCWRAICTPASKLVLAGNMQTCQQAGAGGQYANLLWDLDVTAWMLSC